MFWNINEKLDENELIILEHHQIFKIQIYIFTYWIKN